jgi:monoamine oxidase
MILAVPARMIEKRRIRISPKPEDGLLDAFAAIPMGWYEKIALAFDGPVFGGHGSSYADIARDDSLPLNFELNPFDRPIAVTHVAGSAALELNRAGPQAMEDYALEALVAAFGSDLRSRVTRRAVTTWSADPFINGAYACAKPGQAHLRQRFVAPVHERVFLAGEHTHQSFNATAHGAYESGIVAAERVAQLLGISPGSPDPLWLPNEPHGLSG